MAATCLGCRKPVGKCKPDACPQLVACALCTARVPAHLFVRHIAAHMGRLGSYAAPAHTPTTAPLKEFACPTCSRTFVRRKHCDNHTKNCKFDQVNPAEPPTIEVIDVDPELLV